MIWFADPIPPCLYNPMLLADLLDEMADKLDPPATPPAPAAPKDCWPAAPGSTPDAG